MVRRIIAAAVLGMRIVVCLVFVTSGLIKLADPARFFDDLQAFGLMNYDFAFVTTLVLPWMELLCGLAVLSWRYSASAAVLLCMQTSGFIYFMMKGRASGIDFDCGCFGKWFTFPNFHSHMVFLSVLLIILFIIFFHTFTMARLEEEEHN